MKHNRFSRRILALTVVAAAGLLAACGESDAPLSPSESFVSRMATETAVAGSLPATTTLAKRASPVPVTNNQLFQWAQLQYPELFGTAAPNVIANLPYNGQLFDVREFPGGAYLGISAGRVYGLGPFTNGELKDFGLVQGFSAQVCSLINCGNSGGSSGAGTGTHNGCIPPASEALRTGNRYTAVYKSDVFGSEPSSGESTEEFLVEGSTSFEGQSAIRSSLRMSGTILGQVVDETLVFFDQIANNGLILQLGSESVLSVAGSSVALRTVHTPPFLNTEHTLQPGQSLEKTFTATSTYINSPYPFSSTDTLTTRHTCEARETINVLGRTYDTCRYKVDFGSGDEIYDWSIFGKGISARTETRNRAGAVLSRAELRSGSINGTAI